MIKCFILDDEQHAVDLLESYVKQVASLKLIGTATDPIEAMHLINKHQVVLIFLDIRMPELSGIQLMKIFENSSKFILTTAYTDYALEGYEHDVIDYLLKPISFERFLRAVQKAQNVLGQYSHGREKLPLHPSNRSFKLNPSYMFVKGDSKNKFIKIDYERILFVEGLKNYVSFFLHDQRIVTYVSLTRLEVKLPSPPFYRVHRSYIISIDKVTMIDGNVLYIGNRSIPIGETYKISFLNMVRHRNSD